jgi:hypothetical protein
MALAGYFAGHTLGAVKWNTLVGAARREGGRLTVRDTAGCYSAGLFANLFLPTVVGGDVVRAALAARALGRPEAVSWAASRTASSTSPDSVCSSRWPPSSPGPD